METVLTLTSRLADRISYKSAEIPVDLAYDHVLQAYAIISDASLADEAKIRNALGVFGVTGAYTLVEQGEILGLIFAAVKTLTASVDSYRFPAGEASPAISYEKDTGLIYAAFMQCYHMDLFAMRGKLHWVQFIMLLNNISDAAKLSQVIGYRVMKLPAPNKNNRGEIARIRQMKAIYALEAGSQNQNEALNQGLAGIFAALKTEGANHCLTVTTPSLSK